MLRRFLRLLLLVAACPALLRAQIPGLTLTQVPIPQPRDVNPYSIAGGTGGRIWFTDVTFKQVGYFGADNSITKFRLTDSANATNEVRPLSIAEGPDGNGWFTGYITDSSGSPLERSFVGRVTPAGAVTMFPMPTGSACRQFFGLPACGITTGSDGNLWFAETEVQKVGRITPAGQFTEFSLAFPGVFLLHIASGADGNLWVTDRVRNQGTIWRVTPQGSATEFKVPGTNASPFMITKGPDGNVWFTVDPINSVGRITPAGAITLFPVPATATPNAGLTGIVTGPDGNIWFAEGRDKQIGQLIPSTGAIAEAAVPNGDGPAQIVAISAGAGKIAPQQGSSGIATNAANASNDYTIYKGGISIASLPQLVITKEVVPDHETLAGSSNLPAIRENDEVHFRIKVKNVGGARTSAEWRILDNFQDDFHSCFPEGDWSESFRLGDGNSFFNQLDLRAKGALEPGQELTLLVYCSPSGDLGVSENSVRVFGGGGRGSTRARHRKGLRLRRARRWPPAAS